MSGFEDYTVLDAECMEAEEYWQIAVIQYIEIKLALPLLTHKDFTASWSDFSVRPLPQFS